MNEQLDMRKEAHNLAHFSKKFANESWACFHAFPGPYHKQCAGETLMEAQASASSWSSKMRSMEVDEEVRKLKLKLSDICGKTMIKMIFDNFIHGDLHPGNILVNFTSKGNQD